MYAIVNTGGKQYKVAEGDTFEVELLDAEPGATVELDVIFLADGSKITAEAEKLTKAKVFAEVIEHFKGEKALVFKFKKRKGYKRLRGHRQNLTKLLVQSISPTGSAPAKKAAAEKPAKATKATKAAKVEKTETKKAGTAKAVDEKVEALAPEKKAASTKNESAKVTEKPAAKKTAAAKKPAAKTAEKTAEKTEAVEKVEKKPAAKKAEATPKAEKPATKKTTAAKDSSAKVEKKATTTKKDSDKTPEKPAAKKAAPKKTAKDEAAE
jgi:large subunit ribosomal protein L21